MSSQNSAFSLEEYKAQRQYRDSRRKQYLRRFEIVRQKMCLSEPTNKQIKPQQNIIKTNIKQDKQRQIAQKIPQITQPKQQSKDSEAAELQLIKQNQSLRKQLMELETEERQRLQKFKKEVGTIKVKYVQQIKQLTQLAKKSKEVNEAKMEKTEAQIVISTNKNIQIQSLNKQLEQQVNQSQTMIQKYTLQIKNEYSSKLQQFEKIFNSSNQKIEAMEKEFNEDEFIETTLKNEQLLKTIEESCGKSEETGSILADYQNLLDGKEEIVQQILKNNEMKENEIKKMSELQQKLKIIFQKLNQEKKIYLAENNKMAEDLMEIKNLLTGELSKE